MLEYITKMNNQTIREKADLKKLPIPPSRTRKYNRRPVHLVKTIPHPEDIDKREEQEISKSRPMAKTS